MDGCFGFFVQLQGLLFSFHLSRSSLRSVYKCYVVLDSVEEHLRRLTSWKKNLILWGKNDSHQLIKKIWKKQFLSTGKINSHWLIKKKGKKKKSDCHQNHTLSLTISFTSLFVMPRKVRVKLEKSYRLLVGKSSRWRMLHLVNRLIVDSKKKEEKKEEKKGRVGQVSKGFLF